MTYDTKNITFHVICVKVSMCVYVCLRMCIVAYMDIAQFLRLPKGD